MLQGLLPNLFCLSGTAFFQLVVAAVKTPRADLDFAAVTLREGGGMLLQDSDSISPVLLVEMISDPVPSPKGERTAREATGALRCDFWESDV